MVSTLTPALALFYGQTANKKTINYFYKRNILINTFLLLLVFSGLVLHLNLLPEDRNLQNKNTLLGCHQDGLNYTMDEIGIYDDSQFRSMSDRIHTLNFYGLNLTVRKATVYECPVEYQDHCKIDAKSPLYLLASTCEPGQMPVERFNKIAVPLVLVLAAISTITTFCTFHMD